VLAEGEPVRAEPGVLAASTTVDGVRVLLEVDRNPIPAGEPTWLTTTLINRRPGMLRWITDGCAIHVGVRGEMSGTRWNAGQQQSGAALTFKVWADTSILDLTGPVRLDVTPERLVGRDVGCADLGVGHELAPGGRIVERHLWNGFTTGFGLPPSGPAEIRATFDSWTGDDHGEPDGPEIVASLPILVVDGREMSEPSPGQIIDIALAVPEFRAVLDSVPSIQEWDMPIRVEFDPALGEWLVELRTNRGTVARVEIGRFGDLRGVDVAY
jgi:hypothetical protein